MVQSLCKHLEYLGLIIITYDRFFDQNMIDGNKFTIVWYVDENKLSYVDPNLVTYILEEIRKHFGYMVISRGDTHYFLGMNHKIWKNKKLELIMKHQIEDTLRQFKDICGLRETFPRAHHLWDVNNEA